VFEVDFAATNRETSRIGSQNACRFPITSFYCSLLVASSRRPCGHFDECMQQSGHAVNVLNYKAHVPTLIIDICSDWWSTL